MATVSVRSVVKLYGRRRVVDDVSFGVEPGEFAAVIGPNGAGKTTLVEIVEGHRRPDAGTVSVLGLNPHCPDEFVRLRERVGVVLQKNAFESALRLRDAFRRQESYYRARYATGSLVEALGLGEYLNVPIGRLSEGTKRRVDLAIALVGRPQLVILDEPTAGLDPMSRRSVHSLLAELLSNGVSILMTSHHLDEIERLASTVHVMVGGRIPLSGYPNELVRRSRIEAVVEFDVPRADLLDSLPEGAVFTGTRVRYATSTPEDVMLRLEGWADTHDSRLANLSVMRPSLDDVYASLLDMAGEKR